MDLATQVSGDLGSIVVVGGANTDIVGLSDAPLIDHDSNPGHVEVSAGGVGRNIAENLSKLGARTSLITAFGGNPEAGVLRAHCEAAGIDVSASVVAMDLPGARYVAIADETGDMALALNDMRILERLTAAYLTDGPAALKLREADLIVVDANITTEALGVVAATAAIGGTPLMVDTVSVAKAPRLAPLMPSLAAVKTNKIEGEALLDRAPAAPESDPMGSPTDDGDDIAHAIAATGVERVFLTLAHEGCAYVGPEGSGVLEVTGADVVSTTGAGDSFTAGVALGLLAGLDSREIAALGTAIASRTMASSSSVAPELALHEIITDTQELLR